jgi:hypothetical protein
MEIVAKGGKPFMKITFLTGVFLTLIACGTCRAEREPIAFASIAEEQAELPSIRILVESLREFGGRYREAQFRVYMPQPLLAAEAAGESWKKLGVELRPFAVPAEAAWYPLASWPFAAAKAEEEAESKAEILAWLGPDTVMLDEPGEMILPVGAALGYRPVFHRNINPLFSEPLNEFWQRAYAVMNVKEGDFFAMVTPADSEAIRPYFQAGCLVVRPTEGLLRRWPVYFKKLYADPAVRAMCEKNASWRTFAFQVALTGAFLNHLSREKMLLFSEHINYPVFFREMFGGKCDFHDLAGAVTVRYEHFFREPPTDWSKRLSGPANRIAWLKARFAK